MYQHGLEQGLDISVAKASEKTSRVSRHFVLFFKKAFSIILISRCYNFGVETQGNMASFLHVF